MQNPTSTIAAIKRVQVANRSAELTTKPEPVVGLNRQKQCGNSHHFV
ncbi:MAG: hypothetical protein HZA47_07195 [Planctomycetes bacterium]|nr:hypothetical protein [Planctomycetota bacterium]